ncbi:MAG: hypothetical protein ABFD89_17605 [Bryobacteraceae bacterium]
MTTEAETETSKSYQAEIRTMVETVTKKWRGNRGVALRAELLKEFDRLVVRDNQEVIIEVAEQAVDAMFDGVFKPTPQPKRIEDMPL